MSATCDLSQLVALAPPGAGRIHLHLPGYQPGKKIRSQKNAPLCGVFVPRDLSQAPLDVAQHWPHVRASWAGSGDAGTRHWCPPCLGRLVVLLGLQEALVRNAVLAVANGSNVNLTPTENVGNVLAVRPSGTENGTAGGDTGS